MLRRVEQGRTPDVADADSGGKTAGILRLELQQSPETSPLDTAGGKVRQKILASFNWSQNRPVTFVQSEARLTERREALFARESRLP